MLKVQKISLSCSNGCSKFYKKYYIFISNRTHYKCTFNHLRSLKVFILINNHSNQRQILLLLLHLDLKKNLSFLETYIICLELSLSYCQCLTKIYKAF